MTSGSASAVCRSASVARSYRTLAPPSPLARTMRTYLLLSDLSYCPRLLLLLDNERLRLDCGRLLQDDRRMRKGITR